jgi:hypothetical protein
MKSALKSLAFSALLIAAAASAQTVAPTPQTRLSQLVQMVQVIPNAVPSDDLSFGQIRMLQGVAGNLYQKPFVSDQQAGQIIAQIKSALPAGDYVRVLQQAKLVGLPVLARGFEANPLVSNGLYGSSTAALQQYLRSAVGSYIHPHGKIANH